MNNIGYAFIGTPKGLQTKTGGILENVDIRRYIDLDGNTIKVEPNTELFAIRKVLMDDNEVLYLISQYEYAKEIESQRTGTFFGATLALKGVTAPAEAILLVLSELMASLREYIAPNGRFMATLDRIPLKMTKRMQGLVHNLKAKPSTLEELSGQSLFIQLKDNNDFRGRVNFIHQCLTSKNFEAFSTVYASDDAGIFNFVQANKSMRTAAIGLSYETNLEKLERRYQLLLQNVEQEQATCAELRKQKEELVTNATALANKQQVLSSRYKETEKAIVSNLGKLQKLEKSLNLSVKSLEQKQQTTEQNYQKALQNYDADIRHFQEHLADLKTTSEQLQEEKQRLEQNTQVLQTQKSKLQTANQKLMDDFELIRTNAQKARDHQKQLETTIQALVERNTSLAEQNTQLEAKQEELKRQTEEAIKAKEATQIAAEVMVVPETINEEVLPVEEAEEDVVEVIEVIEAVEEREETLLEIS